jgi:hypothetical protein
LLGIGALCSSPDPPSARSTISWARSIRSCSVYVQRWSARFHSMYLTRPFIPRQSVANFCPFHSTHGTAALRTQHLHVVKSTIGEVGSYHSRRRSHSPSRKDWYCRSRTQMSRSPCRWDPSVAGVRIVYMKSRERQYTIAGSTSMLPIVFAIVL